MQTSEHLTATQYVSFKGFQRLRSAFLQQSFLFESVVTEAQFPLPNFSTHDSAVDAGMAVKADGISLGSAVKFVLMRSPTLNVLLCATPLTLPEAFSSYAAVSEQTTQQTTPEHAASGWASQSQRAADQAQMEPQLGSHSATQNAPLMEHIKAHIKKTVADAAQEIGLQSDEEALPQESDSRFPDYAIALSFDEQAILTFLNQLIPDKSSPLATLSSLPNSRLASADTAKTATAHSNQTAGAKPLSSEKFVLSWAKQLATAPDGAAQASLDNQLQQSLLLNQVITRIRHSLDLSAILETTVAQVREFLSADRLVLYQFDQMEEVEQDDVHTTFNTDEAYAYEYRAATDIGTHSDNIIGRRTHEGHITYESRCSEAIPSVLNFSESECFMPSLSIRARYITGQPVAIDNVDQQYAHTSCLLDFLHQAKVKSKIIAPIVVKEELWGLLIAHQCDDYRHWQETEVLFLQHIAEHLAVAIGQAELYQQLKKQTLSLESCVVERTQNLRDALLAAESANLTKGEFLSTMSHELRTPLTYIIGMSATLLRWSFGELSDRQRSYLDTINHSGEQLLAIINDILDFAKISSGRTFLDVSEFSLEALLREIADHFQSIADKQEVRLVVHFDVAAEQDAFRADPHRLRQILSNLVHNAIKFTPAGGQVTLRLSLEGSVGVFQIEDTGIGIPESQQDLLFEKFKQLESPFQRQYSGTGLGLAMTKRLVELHGGTIKVKSAVGEGSTFSVRLPTQSPERLNDHYQVPATLLDSSKRILLLEVQENSAAIICDLLTADGYEVIWQENVEKMLSQLESLQPVMLIADLSLLSQESDDIKQIQLAITDSGAKVLALVGQSMSQALHIAHHDTLEKPIDPKKLLEKVRNLTLTSS